MKRRKLFQKNTPAYPRLGAMTMTKKILPTP